MKFSAGSLRAALEALTPSAATGWVIAVSGGSDSACLATALVQMSMTPIGRLPIRAVHVDHGLQAAAADFRRACEALCAELKLPLSVIEVAVAADPGLSVEAAARFARYQGFALALAAGECLLTAHHADDQAETLLLQLLRGAGLKGLSAMPACRVLGAGWHVRPLLDVPKVDLQEFGARAGVCAVTDPMNHDLRFDRAYLRAQLWPVLVARWPGAALVLSRTARHLAEAQSQLDESAALTVRKIADGDALSVAGLRLLSVPQQMSALRHWIGARAVPLPSAARLSEALRQILEAQEDHLPTVVWGGHALRRYRDRVCLTAAQPPRVARARDWSSAPQATLQLSDGLGTLRWVEVDGGLDLARLPPTLSVRRRIGGECLKPQRGGKTQSVQHLCQSLGVLPWMRDAVPLIYAGEILISIGDLWHDARWCVADEAVGRGVAWEEAPVLV